MELAGIPGSGKSRATALLAAELTRRQVVTRQPQSSMSPEVTAPRRLARKAWAAAVVALRRPALCLRLTDGLLRSGQGAAGAVARLLQWQVAQHALVHRGGRDAVSLVDEGLLQCLWSVGLRGDLTPVLSRLATARGVRRPDLLVVVHTPVDCALARLAARGSRHSRTQELAYGARLAELQHGERLLAGLVRWWVAAAGPGRCVELDGSDAADPSQIERVATTILQLRRPAG